MNHGSQRPILHVQSPLAFDQCLKTLRSILKRENLGIIHEVLLPNQPSRTGRRESQRRVVLLVWSADDARQALSTDRDAGLLMPFCLSILEGGTDSIVTGPACTDLALAAESVAIRVLARVLDAKINQVFLQLSTHGSLHAAVKRGGGTYRGIQYGSPERGIPDLVLFDDPVTKTTLALALGGPPVGPEAVRQKISDSRQVFCEAQAARNHGKLPDWSWDAVGSAVSCAG